MKLSLLALLLFFFPVPDEKNYSAADFSWLQGSWKMAGNKAMIVESWQMADDSTLKGKSFRVSGTDTVRLETTELQVRKEGVYYIPVVRNQNNNQPVQFKLVSSADSQFVFENKQHDFPQRIVYSPVGTDSLYARIEGIINGAERRSEYFYQRQK